MFKLENLPKDVKEKIDYLDFVEEEDTLGFVYLKDGWCFEWDKSHCEGFNSRKDLIDIVRTCTIREEKVLSYEAIKDFELINLLIGGKAFNEAKYILEKGKLDLMNWDGERFDVNYGVCCFTINVENDICQINNKSIEVWNGDSIVFEGVSLDFLKEQIK